jgi:hypothetical protein
MISDSVRASSKRAAGPPTAEVVREERRVWLTAPA